MLAIREVDQYFGHGAIAGFDEAGEHAMFCKRSPIHLARHEMGEK